MTRSFIPLIHAWILRKKSRERNKLGAQNPHNLSSLTPLGLILEAPLLPRGSGVVLSPTLPRPGGWRAGYIRPFDGQIWPWAATGSARETVRGELEGRWIMRVSKRVCVLRDRELEFWVFLWVSSLKVMEETREEEGDVMLWGFGVRMRMKEEVLCCHLDFNGMTPHLFSFPFSFIQ